MQQRVTAWHLVVEQDLASAAWLLARWTLWEQEDLAWVEQVVWVAVWVVWVGQVPWVWVDLARWVLALQAAWVVLVLVVLEAAFWQGDRRPHPVQALLRVLLVRC